ncbi:MAG: ATP-binding cassette domain-containing protein [Actinomycetota bacterium]|nr:ATP-binding cassette domain-containing protein [Actinomycetota bacterium]
MTAPLFSFEGVVVERGGARVLDGVDLAIGADGLTAVVGRSGSGKSTLLRCCNRLEAPVAGVVRFRGDDVAGLDPLAHRRRVAMIFQAPVAFPGTVADNLAAADETLDHAGAARLLDRVGLPASMLDREADTLSGGEAQRMTIARALATGPEVLLADEASSALDGTARTHLEELARTLAADGLAVVWVTHDLAQVERVADHVVVVDAGRVSWSGRADDEGCAGAMSALAADDATGTAGSVGDGDGDGQP